MPFIGSCLPHEGTHSLSGLQIAWSQKFILAVWNLKYIFLWNTVLQDGWVYHKPTKVGVTESLWEWNHRSHSEFMWGVTEARGVPSAQPFRPNHHTFAFLCQWCRDQAIDPWWPLWLWPVGRTYKGERWCFYMVRRAKGVGFRFLCVHEVELRQR